MESPRIRAVATQGVLEQLDRFEPGLGQRVRKRIPEETLAFFEEASATGWIPLEHNSHMVRSIFEELDDRGVAFYRWVIIRHFASTELFSSFVERVRRLFGATPGTVVAVLPMLWRPIYKGFGYLAPTSREMQRATLELRGCPDLLFDHPYYMRAWSGMLEAIFDFCHVEGTVDCSVHPDESIVRWVLVW